MTLFCAVKRKKAILSDSEDEEEEKTDKPGEKKSKELVTDFRKKCDLIPGV